MERKPRGTKTFFFKVEYRVDTANRGLAKLAMFRMLDTVRREHPALDLQRTDLRESGEAGEW